MQTKVVLKVDYGISFWISVTSHYQYKLQNLQLSSEYFLPYYFNPYLEYLTYCKPYFHASKGARKQCINVYTLQKEWCFIIFQNYVLSFWITISLVSKMATSACKCCGVHKQQPWSDIAFWKILVGSRTDICQYNRRAFFLLYLKHQWISFECLWLLRTIHTQRLNITIHL